MDTQKREVSTRAQNRIEYFIYAYETFDEREIASNLLDIPISDIRQVIAEGFYGSIKQKDST